MGSYPFRSLIECFYFWFVKLGQTSLSPFFREKRKYILNARYYVHHKSSTTINFFYVHLIFLQHFLCTFTPQNGRLSRYIRTITFFSYMLFVEKMLLRLSFFFTLSLRCFIMLTVKSTPRGLVFTRYVSAHTSVREQQQLQNMTTAGCFIVHINAKIKNGIQRFINIAILSESNIRNFFRGYVDNNSLLS